MIEKLRFVYTSVYNYPQYALLIHSIIHKKAAVDIIAGCQMSS